jgi:predicted permease
LNLLGAGADKPATMAALVKDISAIPGVEMASMTAMVPLSGGNSETRVLPEGMAVASRRDAPSVYFHVVGPRYFEMMSIPVRRGREFAETDRDGAPRVAVISETAARRLWPDGDAVGKRFHWGSVDGELVQVVGIAKDANYVMPGEAPKTVIYRPYAQESRGEMTIQLRTNAQVAGLRRPIWDAIRAAVPTLPPPPVTRMVDDMAIVLLPVRLGAALLGAFGALALVLAAAGIYGVASYSVARRTREIGIRSALGATRSRVVRMVLWESGRRVGVGAIVGLLMSIGIGAALSRVLYGVRPADPIVLGAVTLVIATIAMLATLAPARRAAKSDPVAAMRTE